MKKFPVVFLEFEVKMTYAESPIMVSFLEVLIISSPPKANFTAAVAIAVLGHSALTATP
jgi:hypothetical protein